MRLFSLSLLLAVTVLLWGCGKRGTTNSTQVDSTATDTTTNTGTEPQTGGASATQNEGLAGTYTFYQTNGTAVPAAIQIAISPSGTDGALTVQSGPMNCALDFRLTKAGNGYTMTCTGGESLGSCIDPAPRIGTVVGTLNVEPSGKLTIEFLNRAWNDQVFGGANPPSFIFQMPEE